MITLHTRCEWNKQTACTIWTVYDVFWRVSETFHFQDESSIESDEFDMSDSTRMSAVNSDLSSNLEERMQSPQNLQGQQDGKGLILYRKSGIALSFIPILCLRLALAVSFSS